MKFNSDTWKEMLDYNKIIWSNSLRRRANVGNVTFPTFFVDKTKLSCTTPQTPFNRLINAASYFNSWLTSLSSMKFFYTDNGKKSKLWASKWYLASIACDIATMLDSVRDQTLIIVRHLDNLRERVFDGVMVGWVRIHFIGINWLLI